MLGWQSNKALQGSSYRKVREMVTSREEGGIYSGPGVHRSLVGGVGNVLFLDLSGSYKRVWSTTIRYAACLCFMYFSMCVLYFIIRKLETFTKCALRNIA